jgi:hypothetical protein
LQRSRSWSRECPAIGWGWRAKVAATLGAHHGTVVLGAVVVDDDLETHALLGEDTGDHLADEGCAVAYGNDERHDDAGPRCSDRGVARNARTAISGELDQSHALFDERARDLPCSRIRGPVVGDHDLPRGEALSAHARDRTR